MDLRRNESHVEQQSDRFGWSYPLNSWKLRLSGEGSEIVHHPHSVIAAGWTSDEVLQKCREAAFEVLHKKERTERGNCKGISLVANTVEVTFKIIVDRPGNFLRGGRDFPGKAVRISVSNTGDRHQVCSKIVLKMCFVDRQNAYEVVDVTLLWAVHAGFGPLPRMNRVIAMFHDGIPARIQLDDDKPLAWFHV